MKLPDFSRVRILVAGDVMLDRYWFGDVSRISPEAPVPIVHVRRTEERPGGAANVARNITALDGAATLLAVVGNDEAARTLQRLLKAAGVATILGQDPKLYSSVKLRIIGRAQQLVRVDFENEPDHEVLGPAVGGAARDVARADDPER